MPLLLLLLNVTADVKKASVVKAPAAAVPTKVTAYRVMKISYPSGSGCYVGQDLDDDYIEACTTRHVVGVYNTKKEALKAALNECSLRTGPKSFTTKHHLPMKVTRARIMTKMRMYQFISKSFNAARKRKLQRRRRKSRKRGDQGSSAKEERKELP
jgi:hypothetical protein